MFSNDLHLNTGEHALGTGGRHLEASTEASLGISCCFLSCVWLGGSGAERGDVGVLAARFVSSLKSWWLLKEP